MPSPSQKSDNDEQMATRSRRQVILGVGAATALAGCLADIGPNSEDTEQGTNTMSTPDPADRTATPSPDEDGADSNEGVQGLSRAEARDVLPLEALAFRYQPPVGSSAAELWVAVVGETNAAAVRAEAASGTYNEVRPQEGPVDGYLGVPVQVDTDGDEVTVLAIDEAGARGPVATVEAPTEELTSERAVEAVPPGALSFTYSTPEMGDYGTLTIEVTSATDADALVAQPLEAPGLFADRVGDLRGEIPVGAGTRLEVGVEPDGDEVVISASVDRATGEVTRWQGPD